MQYLDTFEQQHRCPDHHHRPRAGAPTSFCNISCVTHFYTRTWVPHDALPCLPGADVGACNPMPRPIHVSCLRLCCLQANLGSGSLASPGRTYTLPVLALHRSRHDVHPSRTHTRPVSCSAPLPSSSCQNAPPKSSSVHVRSKTPTPLLSHTRAFLPHRCAVERTSAHRGHVEAHPYHRCHRCPPDNSPLPLLTHTHTTTTLNTGSLALRVPTA